MYFSIRQGRPADFAALMAIEIDAFETLLASGGVFGEASSSTDEELMIYIDSGMLLVAADKDDRPIGYAGSISVENSLHVAEIDVARQWQRRGVGRALMQAVLKAARSRGLGSVTLTTDRFVPFNAPFYASLGFALIAEGALPDRLRSILEKDHAAGFDPARRVAMSVDLSSCMPFAREGGQPMFSIRNARPGDLERNFDIWRTAVLATHDFLAEDDFLQISDLVRRAYLPTAELIVAVDVDDLAHGFLGALDDHIDALFVHGGSRSRGVGRQLVDHFLAGRSVATVDVNEQNRSGRGFYEHFGFTVFDRSELDDEGRPYPLLKMRYRRT